MFEMSICIVFSEGLAMPGRGVFNAYAIACPDCGLEIANPTTWNPIWLFCCCNGWTARLNRFWPDEKPCSPSRP